ncbi:BadF/BadG/BcrA/BcrD ATPase family protein [Natronohydrobacter thiooxidans]|uniref:BadF/BadG/BcrA/BcrD ATPase family protein n=1 Tax=Natronohydrobacter thiooxidans TaxID=87172 RepID=UPI000A7FDE26|nr:BadF/BadG/BcrA/BcrD ATPase family protein [Natronohydrobacter thiooxidans]
MQIFVGLDGGGTACRAQAQLGCGPYTEILTGGAANVFSDFPSALNEISALLAAALEQARALAPGVIFAPPQIAIGLAGVSESGATTRLRNALPYAQLTILGDIDISLAGAFEDQDGIVMAVGTGSVLARQRSGQMLRLGGYGFTLGDEGSGAWIGREALRRALHARDRLGPDGPLVADIWHKHATLADMISFAGRAKPSDYAALAPLVLHHDRQHCPVAGSILDEGCAYLLAAITRLQEGDTDMPVAPLGGLGSALLDRITGHGGAKLRRTTPKGTALDGAIWTARQCARTEDLPA